MKKGVWFWTFPALCFLTIFFIAPLFFIFMESFQAEKRWGFNNYINVFSQPVFTTALLRTLKISTIVTFLAALLAYPAASAIIKSKRRNLLMSLIILPLMTNAVARTYAWLVIMGRHGLINSVLLSLWDTRNPVQILYTESAVIIGLLQLFLPFMVLSLVSALENMPADVEKAAYSLGANKLQTFWRVVFPLSREGLVFGGTLVFTGSTTAYVTPAMLGGTKLLMLSTLLQQKSLVLLQWSSATVIAVIMVIMVIFINQVFKGRRLEETL